MSGVNDELYPQNLTLLAFKGDIAVRFLDDEVIEGEFVTQDLFNIFMKVDNETVMIPRSQIRLIKGRQNQPPEVDTSQEAILKGVAGPTTTPAPEADRADTQEYPTADQTDTTDSIPIAAIPEIELAEEASALPDDQVSTAEDSDGTVVLQPSSNDLLAELEAGNDDATFVLPDGFGEPTALGDDEDETFVLPGGLDQALGDDDDDDDDGTVILTASASAGLAKGADDVEAEDATVVIRQDEPQPSASFVCTAGPHSGQVFQLEGDVVTIGRSSDNKIALSSDKEISRHHSIISIEAGQYAIEDQNSLNGTFVNNEPVTEPRYLKDNDMVLVGISTLRFQED
jgi:hypothetical protein